MGKLELGALVESVNMRDMIKRKKVKLGIITYISERKKYKKVPHNDIIEVTVRWFHSGVYQVQRIDLDRCKDKNNITIEELSEIWNKYCWKIIT